VQHKGAAQLLADQGLLGCLLAMAAWMVAADGGGAPSASLVLLTALFNIPGRTRTCTCSCPCCKCPSTSLSSRDRQRESHALLCS
jgi:hypothetical protein